MKFLLFSSIFLAFMIYLKSKINKSKLGPDEYQQNDWDHYQNLN